MSNQRSPSSTQGSTPEFIATDFTRPILPAVTSSDRNRSCLPRAATVSRPSMSLLSHIGGTASVCNIQPNRGNPSPISSQGFTISGPIQGIPVQNIIGQRMTSPFMMSGVNLQLPVHGQQIPLTSGTLTSPIQALTQISGIQSSTNMPTQVLTGPFPSGFLAAIPQTALASGAGQQPRYQFIPAQPQMFKGQLQPGTVILQTPQQRGKILTASSTRQPLKDAVVPISGTLSSSSSPILSPRHRLPIINVPKVPLSRQKSLSPVVSTGIQNISPTITPPRVHTPNTHINASTTLASGSFQTAIGVSSLSTTSAKTSLIHIQPSLKTKSVDPSMQAMPSLLHLPNTRAAPVLKEVPSNGALEVDAGSVVTLVENVQKNDPRPEISTDVMDRAKLEEGESEVAVDYDEPDFVWEEYLEETGAAAAPPTSFKHVECSLQSGFVKGMKLEVLNKSCSNTYWVASVVITCGPLLRLRYEGYDEDSSADFWCDVQSADIHPIGWCAVNSKRLQPPEDIKHKYDNWKEFLVNTLTGARTAPSYLLDGKTGTTPVDQIKQGMCLECQHELVPHCVWIVKILENVGGRLLLRYEGSNSAAHDFWMFYLNTRLHPIGWSQDNNCIYRRPDEIQSDHDNYSEWAEILQKSLKDAEDIKPPQDVFKDQEELEIHKFKVGMKLEVVHPINGNQICPGTVKEVIDYTFFIIEVDDFRQNKKPLRICCHGNSPYIFPPNWAYQNGIRITIPPGYDCDFDWHEYIHRYDGEVASKDCFSLEVPEHEFKRGMKLESVNPAQSYQICAATITKIVGGLMWIHLDNSSKLISTHIVDVNSHNIFPVGWCESNRYPMKPPKKTGFCRRKIAVVQPERSLGDQCTPEDFRNTAYNIVKDGDSGETGAWCPKIYFNHRCFSGPMLSKGRIAELPKCVGPGPVILVMKEVLSMLINVAYKSSRVLREIQLDGDVNPRMYQQMLKAKYKGKSYRAVVEICKGTGQIEEFCRQMCIKLECCPNLFGPHYVGNECPENCSQLTKTKYTYYYGKKKRRKIGRPPGGHTNLENGPKKTGKKRRRVNLLFRTKRASADSEGTPQDADDDNKSTESKQSNSSDLKECLKRRKKRRFLRSLPSPPAGVKTRGAKLPKFAFERRTHKKIMLTKRDIPPPRTPQANQSAYKPVKPEDMLYLDTNPLEWSVQDVIQFIKSTDCSNFARLFKEHDIDGQALLLLSLPTVQEHMDLKLGPAIKICHEVERVKIAFYEQFAK